MRLFLSGLVAYNMMKIVLHFNLSRAPGPGDWATTPHVYDLNYSYLTLHVPYDGDDET